MDKRSLLLAKAYEQGVRDGKDSPHELTSGMTWDDEAMNEAYDRGVNDGQNATGGTDGR
jgi:hypothetical protein